MNLLSIGVVKNYTELERLLHLAPLWRDSLADLLSRKNLDQSLSGDAWVYGDAWVSGDARVYGDARVSLVE